METTLNKDLVFLMDIKTEQGKYRMFYSKDFNDCTIKNIETGEGLNIDKDALFDIGISLLKVFKSSTNNK